MKFLGRCAECRTEFDGESDSDPGVSWAHCSGKTYYKGPSICHSCLSKYISGEKTQDTRLIQWPPRENQ